MMITVKRNGEVLLEMDMAALWFKYCIDEGILPEAGCYDVQASNADTTIVDRFIFDPDGDSSPSSGQD